MLLCAVCGDKARLGCQVCDLDGLGVPSSTGTAELHTPALTASDNGSSSTAACLLLVGFTGINTCGLNLSHSLLMVVR